MGDLNKRSRSLANKQKRSQKIVNILIIVAILCLIVLVSMMFTKKSDDKDSNQNNNELINQDENNELEDEHINDDENQSSNEENNEHSNNSNEDMNKEDEEENGSTSIKDADESSAIDVIEGGDEPNVIRTYVANWQPIGTKQEDEEHYTKFEDGSDDRIEIKQAIVQALGVNEDMLTEVWVGNDGHNKIFSIVTDLETNESYQVYLSWIDQEGWQVKKVELVSDFNLPN